MKRMMVAGLAVIIMLLMAGNTSAQRNSGECRLDKIKGLNLTDAQKGQIEAFRTKHQKAMIDLRADLQKSMIDQRELMKSGDVQRDKYIAAVDKTNKIREKMDLARANHRMDVYGVLDKEQKAKFSELGIGSGRGQGQTRGMHKQGRFGGRGQGYGRGFGGGIGNGLGYCK